MKPYKATIKPPKTVHNDAPTALLIPQNRLSHDAYEDICKAILSGANKKAIVKATGRLLNGFMRSIWTMV
jgi:hypothetical protein